MTDAAYERLCITTMLVVCSVGLVLAIAFDTRLTAASIDTKGTPGLRGGDLRADKVSDGTHSPVLAVRFRRPQLPVWTYGSAPAGSAIPATLRWEAARVGATSALPIPSPKPGVEIQRQAVLDANSGAGRPALEPAPFAIATTARWASWRRSKGRAGWHELAHHVCAPPSTCSEPNDERLLGAGGSWRNDAIRHGGVPCDRPRESETRSSIARWSDSAVPPQATSAMLNPFIASEHLAVGEPNMSRLFWRWGSGHRAVAVGARTDDSGGQL